MIYVLTREINQYDQDGEYFVHAWNYKPTTEDIIQHVGSSIVATHVASTGGGRIMHEEEWYHLREVKN
jgi:shikimate kinase